LMVKVSPDKAEYHAGESAVLAIEVTDGSGRPAQAIVSVNVVDDAVYALAAESVNLVGGLYTDTVPADELGTYSSNLAVSSFVARAQGEKLKDGDAVTLDAQITGPVPFSVRTSARAFEAKALAAPVLVPGVYTVTLSAEGPGGLKDVVRRTFRVEAPVAIEER